MSLHTCLLSYFTVHTSRPPELHLGAFGEIVDLAINNISSVYPGFSVDKYVIMPNHVHMIVRIDTDKDGRQVAAPTVSSVVGQMKRWASIQAKTALWQKSFHEHVIRNADDYREVLEYIDGNPAKWAEDRYYTAQKQPVP